MPTQSSLDHYYNRYAKDKNWHRILFLAGLGIQAPEYNELQDMTAAHIKGIADALFSDGHIVEGCEITVDLEGKVAKLDAGKVYIDGHVWSVPAATLRVPADGTAQIGVRLAEQTVTYHQDATLRDPSEGCPNYMKPGSARLVKWAEWGIDTDVNLEGQLYPIYTVTNLVVVNQNNKLVSNIDEFMHHLARYDRESHGYYIIEGLRVQALQDVDGTQAFSVGSGKAHVQGYEVSISPSRRFIVDGEANVIESEAEPHVFSPDGEGHMRLDVNHSPIDAIQKIGVTYENTTTVTHGGYSGCMDNLPHTSVTEIVRIKQGATTYTPGSDYRLTADQVDWSPQGGEPAPGSQYEITYQYRSTITPEELDSKGFEVSGLVPGSLILVDYSYRLPRIDLICLDRNGTLHLVKGVAHRFAPVAPSTPPGMLKLATVHQTWDGLPKISNDAVKAVYMSDIENMRKAIVDLYDLVAIEQLKSDARDSTPAAVHGVFVDPFTSDNMRDQGTEQTGAIVGGTLMLPIAGMLAEFPEVKNHLSLDYVPEVVVEQDWKTGSMQINPYQAFEPLPSLVALDPSVDRWSYFNEEKKWTSDATRDFFQGQGTSSRTTVTTSVEIAEVIVEEDVHMRVRDVGVKASNFGPGERFQILIDSVEAVSRDNQADENGMVDTVFTIPTGVPSGERMVEIVGTASKGRATYTGLGTISTNVYRNVTNRLTTFFTPSPPDENARPDPLAQTFTLTTGRHILGVDLFFTVKGISTVRIQIRETTTGIPNQSVVAEGEIQASEIREGQSNRISFPFPVYLSAGIEYAIVVMADTSDHEVAIAELGGWDADKGQWVKGQSYQTGVLLSSSNASTWTPHQNSDLWFKLIGARFTAATKRVFLGNVEMDGVTELLPLADLLTPVSGTDATFVISKDGTEIARVQPAQVLSLGERLDGTYRVEVELTGREIASPVIFNGTQILLGKVGETADYVSRSFACGTAKKVSVRLDTLTPGASKVQVYVQTSASGWSEATLDSFDEIGDGWRRRNYSLPCARQETRVKIVLTGTPAERPQVASLRGVILDAS